MIYNIAVFGSCASRDNFYSGINPDYKNILTALFHHKEVQ